MEGESVAVDIRIGNTLQTLLKCEKKGEALSKHVKPSIYMVPSRNRDLSPNSFNPKVVAIGPLHRRDKHLHEFEAQKETYLHNWLLCMGLDPDQTLRNYVENVISSIEKIKACYDPGAITYDDVELATMMVIDACFILEFTKLLHGTNKMMTHSIYEDLLLIENQIPYFVLQIIFNCTFKASGRMTESASLTSHLYRFLKHHNFVEVYGVVFDDPTPDHLLGLLHRYFQPLGPMSSTFAPSRKRHSAMELDRSGVNFKPSDKDQNWAMAMKVESPLPLFPWFRTFMTIPPFSWFQRPTLRMPQLSIYDGSKVIFRNLVVYEQNYHVKTYVTSYLFAMDMLIDTPEDVALLVKSGVIVSLFGSNEEAADMINKLCKNCDCDFFYSEQWDKIDDYYKSYWPNTLAGAKRKYFSNPWSIIALIAAFVLFALTVVQTIFTIIN